MIAFGRTAAGQTSITRPLLGSAGRLVSQHSIQVRTAYASCADETSDGRCCPVYLCSIIAVLGFVYTMPALSTSGVTYTSFYKSSSPLIGLADSYSYEPSVMQDADPGWKIWLGKRACSQRKESRPTGTDFSTGLRTSAWATPLTFIPRREIPATLLTKSVLFLLWTYQFLGRVQDLPSLL